MKKNRFAFSLIELSIVLLIVIILIAGIFLANKMLTEFRIVSARTQTQSSPVSGIKNLVAWFESSSEASFDSFVDYTSSSANKIVTWYDINPQTTSKNNAAQSNSSIQPTLVLSNLNGLPVARFTYSSGQYLNLPNGTIPYNNSPYTIFIVARTNSFGAYGMLGSGVYQNTNLTNAFRFNDSGGIVNYWWDIDITTSDNVVKADKFYVFSFLYDQSNRFIYINGSLSTSVSSSNNQASSSNNTIGKTYSTEYMNGDLAEIIIYNRDLTVEERESVEKYLSKKWQVPF